MPGCNMQKRQACAGCSEKRLSLQHGSRRTPRSI